MRYFLLGICSFFCFNQIFSLDLLEKLMEGNKRFVNGDLTYPELTTDKWERLRETQEPYAVILACADSRVSPELIFDQGLGDLFVVRVAGNIAADVVLESINYAVSVLHAQIILVMGHENCGAVKAVLDGNGSAIPEIASLIEPSFKMQNNQKPSLGEAIDMNVKEVVSYLKTTPVINKLIEQKKLTVIGSVYNFDSGEVEILQ